MQYLHCSRSKEVKLTVRIALPLIALIVGLSQFAAAQVAGTTPNLSAPRTTPKAASLQIVSPRNGQKIGVNFVNVRYEVTNPAAAANPMPTFHLQLDSGSPISTNSTEYTFTGLNPGAHTVRVEMVDANGTPVSGTRAQVRFVVASRSKVPGMQGPSATAEAPGVPALVATAFDRRSPENAAHNPATAQKANAPSQQQNGNQGLPSSNSALPLLSVIGFGVLVGGIASALKTR